MGDYINADNKLNRSIFTVSLEKEVFLHIHNMSRRQLEYLRDMITEELVKRDEESKRLEELKERLYK